MSANDGNKPKDPKKGEIGQIIQKILTKSPGDVPVGNIGPINNRLRELMKAHEAGTPPETGAKSCKKPGALSPETEECLRRTTEIIHRAAMLGPGELRHAIENMPGFEDIKQHPGPITPELIDFLFGKPDRKNLLVPDDPFSKENMYSPDPPYLIPQRTVYDVKSGMPIPQVTSTSSMDEIREAYRKAAQPSRHWWVEDTGPRPTIKYDDKFREPPPVIKKIRSMLDKDKRLAEYDKEVIVFNLLNDKYPLYGPGFSLRQSNESLGDIVLKKVEEYLAKKEIDLKTPRQIDAETGVRILSEHVRDMAGLKQIKEEGWLSPVFKPISVYWHSEGEVLQSVQAIPKSRLEDLTPGGKTVREVLKEIVDSTVFESVRSAAKEKLE